MNRSAIIMKSTKKSDPRTPFDSNGRDMLTGYLTPQMHKNLRRLPSAKKKRELP